MGTQSRDRYPVQWAGVCMVCRWEVLGRLRYVERESQVHEKRTGHGHLVLSSEDLPVLFELKKNA